MAHSEVWKFPVKWRKKAQLAAIRMSELSENYCPFMREQGNSAEINLCWEHWQIWWVAESVHGKKKVFRALVALIEATVLWHSVSSHRGDKTLDKEGWECRMRDSKARHCLLQLPSKKCSLFASTMLLLFCPPAWEIITSLVTNKEIKESGQGRKGEE